MTQQYDCPFLVYQHPSIDLEISRLQLCEHTTGVVLILDGFQLRHVLWAIAREDILSCCSIILVDVSVKQVPGFRNGFTFGDETGCKAQNAIVISNVRPGNRNVDN